MKKILVVDDDQAILEAISIVLEGEGYNVKTVLEAEKAVTSIQEFHPDMIFLDLLLSGREGTEIADEIKRDDQLRNVPVILISAHPNAQKTAECCGADAFLAKPFDLNELLDIVKNYT